MLTYAPSQLNGWWNIHPGTKIETALVTNELRRRLAERTPRGWTWELGERVYAEISGHAYYVATLTPSGFGTDELPGEIKLTCGATLITDGLNCELDVLIVRHLPHWFDTFAERLSTWHASGPKLDLAFRIAEHR